jgi:hypothetical protein
VSSEHTTADHSDSSGGSGTAVVEESAGDTKTTTTTEENGESATVEYDAAALAARINESVTKLTHSVAMQSERVQSKLLGVKRAMEQADVLKAHLAQKLNARTFKVCVYV